MSQEETAGDPSLHSDPPLYEEEHPPTSSPPPSLGETEHEPIGEVAAEHGPSHQTEEESQDQSQDDTKGHVTECSESVSLEPETTEGDVEPSEEPPSKGWGWGSWGKAILTTATSTMGQGLSSVREKAGVTLRGRQTSACEEAEEAVEVSDPDGTEPPQPPSGPAEGPVGRSGTTARGVLSSITSAMQNTGKSMLTGGLDALEFIGKKTMTVLAESDPGFKKTKTLMQRTVSLSQMLREAKEKERERLNNQVASEPTAHYSILFDDYQGLSHLEALEILSNESEARVQAALSSLEEEQLELLKKDLIEIKELFIIREEEEEGSPSGSGENAADGEEFVSVLTELLFDLHVAATPDKLNKARIKAYDWVKEVEKAVAMDVARQASEEVREDGPAPCPAPGLAEGEEKKEGAGEEEEGKAADEGSGLESVFLSSVGSLAEVTARSIEQLHKVAELILHGQDVEKPAVQQARVLSRLTCAMCKEVDCLARRFSETLVAVGSQAKAEELNPLVNCVVLEGSNSTSYIHNAFQLLLPVLQISHIQASRSSAHANPQSPPTD